LCGTDIRDEGTNKCTNKGTDEGTNKGTYSRDEGTNKGTYSRDEGTYSRDEGTNKGTDDGTYSRDEGTYNSRRDEGAYSRNEGADNSRRDEGAYNSKLRAKVSLWDECNEDVGIDINTVLCAWSRCDLHAVGIDCPQGPQPQATVTTSQAQLPVSNPRAQHPDLLICKLTGTPVLILTLIPKRYRSEPASRSFLGHVLGVPTHHDPPCRPH
jgi:hypothetical protein